MRRSLSEGATKNVAIRRISESGVDAARRLDRQPQTFPKPPDRIIPKWFTAEMTFTGQTIEAQEAYRIGELNKVLPRDQRS